MARFTYLVAAALALGGSATAVIGIVVGEGKPISIGLVLILGGMVFARLYQGARQHRIHSSTTNVP